MDKGKFITIEGGEGAGKTTNLNFIGDYLSEKGKDVVVTREPGGTPIGEQIRTLLLDTHGDPICKETELLLIFSARVQHLKRKIIPMLNAGCWIVCDRFTDASFAYQGGGRGIDFSHIEFLKNWLVADAKPDLTFLFDIPVEIGIARARNRSIPDRFEAEEKDFFCRVRESYLMRAKKFPHRIKVIDAKRSLEIIQTELVRHLDQLILG